MAYSWLEKLEGGGEHKTMHTWAALCIDYVWFKGKEFKEIGIMLTVLLEPHFSLDFKTAGAETAAPRHSLLVLIEISRTLDYVLVRKDHHPKQTPGSWQLCHPSFSIL